MITQYDKLNSLWEECLGLLTKYSPKTKSKFSEFVGYRISEKWRQELDIDYVELVQDYAGNWVLLSDGGYSYSLSTLPMETVCELTDLIIKKYARKA